MALFDYYDSVIGESFGYVVTMVIILFYSNISSLPWLHCWFTIDSINSMKCYCVYDVLYEILQVTNITCNNFEIVVILRINKVIT